jgi:transcription elongation factor Elf1
MSQPSLRWTCPHCGSENYTVLPREGRLRFMSCDHCGNIYDARLDSIPGEGEDGSPSPES